MKSFCQNQHVTRQQPKAWRDSSPRPWHHLMRYSFWGVKRTCQIHVSHRVFNNSNQSQWVVVDNVVRRWTNHPVNGKRISSNTHYRGFNWYVGNMAAIPMFCYRNVDLSSITQLSVINCFHIIFIMNRVRIRKPSTPQLIGRLLWESSNPSVLTCQGWMDLRGNEHVSHCHTRKR